ncbi:MAG: transporter substrate-binding domain-containing protein, partial [[Eubacterium] sulci]|nr:transporter substrate-binding domain-containing protein [[Eubacterium] sulci]
EFKSFGFDALIPAVNAKNCDVIAAGMTANEDRVKKVDFSNTYYDSGNAVLVKSDNTTIKGIDDLTPDMTVAVQIGTTGADKANELKEQGKIKDVKVNDGVDTCLLQVKNGDVDALIIDKPVADRAVKANKAFKTVGETLDAESYAFAVAKGDKELLEKINKGLENIKKDGTYEKLYKKWFEGK